MSLKSRKRADKNQSKQSPSNPLPSQKQAIRRATVECFVATAIFFVLTIAATAMGFCNGAASQRGLVINLAGLIVFAVFLNYLISFVRRFYIFQKFNKVVFSTEQDVSMYCQKIVFLCQPVSRFSSVVMGVVLVDESGNKFYYVFPEKRAPFDSVKKHIKKACVGNQLDLICYKETNIIKELPLGK